MAITILTIIVVAAGARFIDGSINFHEILIGRDKGRVQIFHGVAASSSVFFLLRIYLWMDWAELVVVVWDTYKWVEKHWS